MRVPSFPFYILTFLAGVQFLQAGLVNRWSFNNTAGSAPSGTTIADSVSGAIATIYGQSGTAASFTGSALRLPGTSNGNHSLSFLSAYVNLPNGIISSKTNLSVEIWATPYSVTSYDRLFDFGSTNITYGTGAASGEIIDVNGQGQTPGTTNGVDYLYMTFAVGSNGNAQRMNAFHAGSASGGGFDSALATTMGTRHHYVFTFEDGVGTYGSGGGRAKWYRDNSLIFTKDVDFHLSSVNDVNNWLGRSQWTNDWNANASYDEVRIYNHALSLSEIAANDAAGPDTIVNATPPPVPDHVWTFTQQASSTPASGTTFVDGTGGTVMTLRGNGATLTGSSVVLPGTTTGNQPASTIAAYLDLPNGIVSANPSISFEAWVTPLSSQNWQRLFDFGRCTTTSGSGAQTGEIIDGLFAPGTFSGYDNVSLSLNAGTTLGGHQLEGQIGGGTAIASTTTVTTTAGTQYHYVVVIDDGVGTYGASGAQLRWYRNGALQGTQDVNFHLTQLHDVNNWIGRSQYSGDNNSNISLNEVRIYSRTISAAEIAASYAAGPDPSVGPVEPLPPVPAPTNRWSFNSAAGSAPNGTTFTDAGLGTVATVRGNGATLSGTGLVLPGTTTGNANAATIAAYLDFPNGFFSSKPSATYEIWLKPVSSKNWQRIFDFGRCNITSGSGAQTGEIIDGPTAPGASQSYDGVMLSLNNGGMLGSHRLEAIINGAGTTTVNTDLSGSTAAGTKYHYALVVEDGVGTYGSSGCQVRWYRNGTLEGSMDLSYHVSSIHDVNNWIGRSAWSADTNSNIEIDELRVHSRALTVQELLSSIQSGPDTTFPPPVAMNDSATIHPDQKVLLDVLANDTGSPIPGTLQITSPPSVGAATVKNGKILYSHSGSIALPVTFNYSVANISGSSSQATVTINFATELRLTNPSLAMPSAPPATDWALQDALPGVTFNEPICIATPPGETNRIFICERMAKVQCITNTTSTTPAKNLFLDLQQVVAGRSPTETIEDGANSEFGLLGLAFHPNYATNGYFYVAYSVRINGGSYYERISRFHVSGTNANVADPASELILLQQLDEGPNHNGGDLHFGQDGYLYYTAGDEENGYDTRHNSQRITKDFFSGIFRFDVDKKPGNLEPNPHAAIPTDAGTARFSVPVDNPFVYVALGGTWNGVYTTGTIVASGSDPALSTVRTEFWATGLRHVWRFSFDPLNGDLWAGDVGQDTYEEVDKIVKGGNYGWVWREAAHDTGIVDPQLGAKPSGFVSIDPVYEYVHTSISGGDAQFKGNSVCGGCVYRGSRFPSLYGQYIFCDSVSGHVWKRDPGTGVVTRLTGVAGIYGYLVSMGVDPSNQDILFCDYINGRILRLATATVTTSFPQTLSATGLFADLSDLSPSPGLIPYFPNLKFWSDFADKTRWFAIPSASGTMTWAKDANWTFPAGMLAVKHFDMEMERGNPASKKRLETRLLVNTGTSFYGVSYQWNEAQTEATLVPDEGAEFDLNILESGTTHVQHWAIPARSSCLTCHTQQAGGFLSFTTRQFNQTATINGFTGNQLTLLHGGGFFTNDPGSPNLLPRHLRANETAYPVEARVRSYLAVNCAYCHRADGTVSGANWDGRPEITLAQTNLINGIATNNGGDPANRYIVTGNLAHSIVYNRVAKLNGFTRMPPLATSELDADGIAMLQEWIASALPARLTYDQWRVAHFDSSSSPEGEPSADPDGDGRNNQAEFIANTDPQNGSSFLATQFSKDGTNATVTFNTQAARSIFVETSTDLIHWTLWDVPGNNGMHPSGTVVLIGPALGPGQFFRLQIEGN